MVKNGLLSKIEGDAIQAFYDFLSVEGAHALSSQRTQARLSKNMTIEWGLLILSRVRAAAPS